MPQKPVELPKTYAEALERLRGRKQAYLPDGRMVIDYGDRQSIAHKGKAVIVVDKGIVSVTYWDDGAVEHAKPEKKL